ncbi:metallophosphoesterase [Alkalihalobacillus sp. AL-G]|uniref:metallophosphoesterase n=1 Tax=Alkalihalobacillus sp. AL-G TaxID=2926399 RepID=UPI00272B02E2|nr:metallophosphoesterase [Alkalihalobacillus sp. AL-G]WLD95397.1 metallophosphoesterase [Alkalihalobacillus sp. AL-G]
MYILIVLLLSIAFFGIYKAYKNTHQFTLNRIKINSPERETTSKLNILHISDMHLENISITPEQLFESLQGEPIDLIALTGDFLDRKRSLSKLPQYLKVFQCLNPTYGTYAVFGNHDYVLNKDHFSTLEKTLREHDCRTLRNENNTIDINGMSVNLIGIDNFGTGHSDLDKAYKNLPETGFNLVLTHDPNVVLNMKETPYDYLLSGHFHGGQIHWPKPYHLIKMGKLVRLNMVKGLHHMNGKPFYISEGLGQTGFNIRVGSRPEITLHEVNMKIAESKNEVAS